MIHRIIGGMVLVAWLWLVFHLHRLTPALEVSASSGIYRAGRGAVYVLIAPLLSAALLIFPDFFANRFSPSSEMTGEPLLGTGVWRFFGYFGVLVSWGLVELFRS
ncbi:hypothetical protein SAMN05216570_3835 [Dyella sp. OK004]|uniref:hypothetical protein n=1 Tax=Dyella sp. OK004 TaxID=1855292 RepID=UPI0008F4525F|nr:hypothetical protein [Dyella sp. OK004]SFS18860.1 hypothetical protein SAMN05216570_3835 [Dyella sp. OK004]